LQANFFFFRIPAVKKSGKCNLVSENSGKVTCYNCCKQNQEK
jgi:hypothetical protein